jgi:hypothetical protein
MIRVPTIFDFDQGNRKQMQIEAAHYKLPRRFPPPWSIEEDCAHGVADATIVDGYRALPMKADVMSRFRASAKVCSLVIMVLLVIVALGPGKWTPRTALGWQFDHFIG